MNILKEMNQWNINQETLLHPKELLEYEKRPLIGINSKFDELIVSLRTAVSDDSGRLDKGAISYHNVLDAFRRSQTF